MKKEKISMVQMLLTVLSVVTLLVSNVITPKQIVLPFNITMTGAIVIFPITYILSDVFSEVYGYKYSRFVCYLGFIANAFMVVVYQIVINLKAPEYWTLQEAFQSVLGNTPRILLASMLAFLIGDWVNDLVFAKMKEKYKNTHEKFGYRAILSSLVGEIADSLIFLPIAFIGLMPIQALVIMTITQVFIKTGYEIVILPITKFMVTKVSRYEKGLEDETEYRVDRCSC